MKPHARFGGSILAGFVLAAIALTAPSAFAQAGSGEPMQIYQKQASFDDVKFGLEDAIITQGLKVIYHGNIKQMLDRTGKDVGSTKAVYLFAEFWQFCSARWSRATMEADRQNLGFCPYTIFAYEDADKPGTVNVGYRRPVARGSAASQKALGEVEKLLDTIARAAVE